MSVPFSAGCDTCARGCLTDTIDFNGVQVRIHRKNPLKTPLRRGQSSATFMPLPFFDIQWPSPVIIGELLRKSIWAPTWLQFLMVPDRT